MRVADMTDEQVVDAFFSTVDAVKTAEASLIEASNKLRASLDEDGTFTKDQIDEYIRVQQEVTNAWITSMQVHMRRLVSEHLTINQMRALLEFRDQYPHIQEKQEEIMVKAATFLANAMQELAQELDNAMEEVYLRQRSSTTWLL